MGQTYILSLLMMRARRTGRAIAAAGRGAAAFAISPSARRGTAAAAGAAASGFAPKRAFSL
jgi:hypothetical protein